MVILNRKRWFGTLLAMLATVATTGWAVRPAGEDLLGIYTEAGGAGYANTDAGQGSTVQAYLLLTGCSAPDGVSGWECTVEVPPQVLITNWGLTGVAINVAGGPPGYMQGPHFAVGLNSPLLNTEAILLCTITIYVMSTSPAYFFLHPVQEVPSVAGKMCYAPGVDFGHLREMSWSSGSESLAVFGINTGPLPHFGGGTIPVLPVSWGRLKNTYR